MTDAAPDWSARLAQSRAGLGLLSFGESTIVPIPLEAVIAPLMVGHHAQALRIALVVWLGSLAGAALFYGLGLWLMDPVVRPVLEWLDLAADFDALARDLRAEGFFWAVFLLSLAPAPMQLATLGAGAVQGSFPLFLAAIGASREIRYFGLALVAQVAGPGLARRAIPAGRVVTVGFFAALGVWAVLQIL